MSINAGTNFQTTPDFLAAHSRSGGTGSQHGLNFYDSMDFGDASSDDGDQLNTPISDSAQLVQVAYPPGLSDTFEPNDVTSDMDERATAVVAAHCPPISQSCFSTPPKLANSPLFNELLSVSPASALSPPSFASPSLDPSMLCSSTLLDTRISLDDSSLDLYPSSMDASVAPLSSPQKPSFMKCSPSRLIQVTNQSSSPLQYSPQRKRASDTQSPLNSSRAGQKPKLSRTIGSEFLPSTLGRSYCARFPPEHRLRSDFVRMYALEAELGSGGYGFVMTARHRCEGHEVAVKFIPKNKIPRYGWITNECGESVPKEAWYLSKIGHPAIVKFFDLFQDEVYFYVVMELHGTPWFKKRNKFTHGRQFSPEPREAQSVDENVPPTTVNSVAAQADEPKLYKPHKHTKGPLVRPTFERRASHDLFECIEQSKHKRFSEDDAKYIFAQVVDVVDYLDQLGITHCDIKDENVVIDKDLKIKLIDFGSVISDDPAQARPFYKNFYGTAAYASPEIIQNQSYQAPSAEIWAIGVLLSFLITGTSPFPTEDDKLHGRIVLDDASRRRISDECYHLLRRCLQVDPEHRADIAEVKDHPWLAACFEKLGAERS